MSNRTNLVRLFASLVRFDECSVASLTVTLVALKFRCNSLTRPVRVLRDIERPLALFNVSLAL